MSGPLRLGIVGTGLIADVIAETVGGMDQVRLVAVASRREAVAADFAARHGSPRVFGSWRELVAWDEVDAVYVATPTSAREEIAVGAARRGKHLLAEKPFASVDSLRVITAACRDHGVALMDATHFAHHPRTEQLKRELPQRIGTVQAVRSCFYFPSMDRANIRFDPEKEPTGAIGDMAWYSMRAVAEFMPGDLTVLDAAGTARRDERTEAVVGGAGYVSFSGGRTTTWDVGYDCGAFVMDLDLLGTDGAIGLDDFVLDWSGGFGPGDPDYPVGFTERSGIASPGEFQRVHTPSAHRATELMMRHFVAIAGDPTGQATQASMAISELTQELLDAVWERLTVS